MSEAPAVPAKAKQDAEAREWVEASIWTERMLAALETASKEANGPQPGGPYPLAECLLR
jgi:hypothetical protein